MIKMPPKTKLSKVSQSPFVEMVDNISKNDFVDLVHIKSVGILEKVGFCVPHKDTLSRLENAGFPVDRATQMVRITPELLDEALATLPKDVKLYSSGGIKPAEYNQRSCFMGAGTPVNVFDLETGERRPSTSQDVRDLIKLQDALTQVDIVRPTVTANDVGENSDLIEIAELLRHTNKPIVHRTLSPQRVDTAVEMLSVVAGSEAAFREKPNFATLYCPISPGYFTQENIACMLRWASYGVPLTLLSMAMGGASAPATLAGALVVINTDILAWIVVLQILYPNTPLLYGSVSSMLDMRTGILPLGAPERGMLNSGAAKMALYYGIPSMCGGLSSDAKELDAQAGFEKAITAIPLMQEKASIIYGVGATEAGLSISYTQMILDDEFIAGLRRLMQSFSAQSLDEEVELIEALTPRGNFLSSKHTRRTYQENWQPNILSRMSYENWQAKDINIEKTCRQNAKDIIEGHKPKYLSTKVEAELEIILRRHFGSDFAFDD